MSPACRGHTPEPPGAAGEPQIDDELRAPAAHAGGSKASKEENVASATARAIGPGAVHSWDTKAKDEVLVASAPAAKRHKSVGTPQPRGLLLLTLLCVVSEPSTGSSSDTYPATLSPLAPTPGTRISRDSLQAIAL